MITNRPAVSFYLFLITSILFFSLTEVILESSESTVEILLKKDDLVDGIENLPNVMKNINLPIRDQNLHLIQPQRFTLRHC